MSEGAAQNEQAVVGEPASHPHQAVVVGEPPEEMAPVLGEPVLLANGLGDRPPISPPSADDTSVNGVQTSTHLHSGLEPPPAAPSSIPSSAASNENSPNPQEGPTAEENSPLESHIMEAPVEAGAHRSDLPATENPYPSEPHNHEVSSASDVPAIESTDAADAPSEIVSGTYDANSSVDEEAAADFPNVVEVSHIADMPSEAPPPVPTQNPFLALDEGSAAADEKEYGESLSREDPVALDRSLTVTPVSDEVPVANVPPAQDETLSKGLGPSDDSQQEEAPSPLSASQEVLQNEDLPVTQTASEDIPSEGSKVSESVIEVCSVEPVKEEAHSVEPEQSSQGDVPVQDSDAITTEVETDCAEVEQSLEAQSDQVSERDASVQENDTRGLIPAGSETASSGALSRETALSEGLTNESSTPHEDVFHEDNATSNSSQVLNGTKTPAEAPPADSPVASQDTRTISPDECLVDHAPTEEACFPPAANGDNGFQHGEDCNLPLERGQDLSKDIDESAEGKEKPGSRMKLPLIVTGLAIAAVSVVFVSISRPH